MPKLGIAIDETALSLLRKHAGSPRRVGALIATLIRQYDFDEAYGYKTLQHQLHRLEQHIFDLLEKEVSMQDR